MAGFRLRISRPDPTGLAAGRPAAARAIRPRPPSYPNLRPCRPSPLVRRPVRCSGRPRRKERISPPPIEPRWPAESFRTRGDPGSIRRASRTDSGRDACRRHCRKTNRTAPASNRSRRDRPKPSPSGHLGGKIASRNGWIFHACRRGRRATRRSGRLNRPRRQSRRWPAAIHRRRPKGENQVQP